MLHTLRGCVRSMWLVLWHVLLSTGLGSRERREAHDTSLLRSTRHFLLRLLLLFYAEFRVALHAPDTHASMTSHSKDSS